MRAVSVVKLTIAFFLIASLAVFILQNRQMLELRFLFWTFEARRAFMLFVVFGSGLVIGWILATISQLAARGRDAAVHGSRSA